MSMTTLFCAILAVAVLLTFLARRTHDILLRVGASLFWLASLVYLLVGGDTSLILSSPWIQVLAFGLFVMIIVPLLWQIRTDTKHEASIRSKSGHVSETQSYTSFERKPKNKKPTALERQSEYKELLKERRGRK